MARNLMALNVVHFLAAMAFINTGKNRGFFRKNQCKYGKLLSEFFGPSCAPGALDLAHNNEGQLDKLCSLCRPSVQISLETIESGTFHKNSKNDLKSIACIFSNYHRNNLLLFSLSNFHRCD